MYWNNVGIVKVCFRLSKLNLSLSNVRSNSNLLNMNYLWQICS